MSEHESPFVKPSPLPDLARRQTEHLEAALAQMRADSAESKARDRRSTRIAFITLVVAIATLIAAIVPLIH